MPDRFRRLFYDEDTAYKIHITQGNPAADELAAQMHYDSHPIIEYFKEGRGIINIEGKGYPFASGDVIIVTPTELHACHFQEDTAVYRISVHLSRKLLEPFDCDVDTFFGFFDKRKKGTGNVISAETVTEYGIDTMIEKLAKYASKPDEKYRVLARCKAIELLHIMSSAVQTNAAEASEPNIESDLINKILQYITNHYKEPLTLSTIAEHFYHSKYHICTMFKKYVGVTVTEYINIRRIHCINDLIRGGYSIHEACFAAGFHNYSNFYRVYTKHMGITPQQFKSKQKT